MQPFQAKCLFWEVLGLRFCIIFANFLHVFFMLLSRQHFCLILADLGLQRRSLLEHCFTNFANFACKNDMLELGHENEAFLALIWRGRRQWGGLPESSDSAENGEWVQARPAPRAGVRRIYIMGYALCRRPPIIAHCFRIADSWQCCKRILVSIFGTQTCNLA